MAWPPRDDRAVARVTDTPPEPLTVTDPPVNHHQRTSRSSVAFRSAFDTSAAGVWCEARFLWWWLHHRDRLGRFLVRVGRERDDREVTTHRSATVIDVTVGRR
jgi:hypothetical protein